MIKICKVVEKVPEAQSLLQMLTWTKEDQCYIMFSVNWQRCIKKCLNGSLTCISMGFVLLAVFPNGKIRCRTALFRAKPVEIQDLIKCFCSKTNQHSEWTGTWCGWEMLFCFFLSVFCKIFNMWPLCLCFCRISRISSSLHAGASFSQHPSLVYQN